MPETSPKPGAPGFLEFVGLIAVLMSLTALAIDFLLPAFPEIGADFAVADPNRMQLLVYVYMLGFAIPQLLYGPLSDALGRRPVMIAGILIYLGGCLLALVSTSFDMLIAARMIQGFGAAAARVLAISIVRDRFGGREMAKVMSFTMMVFIIVPVLAPALGSLVLAFGNWHLIFLVMTGLGLLVLGWYAWRMPETLHEEHRLPLSAGRIGAAFAFCLRNRLAMGYSTAMGLLTGCLMGYIGSSQQIFEGEVYGLGSLFAVAFGLMALTMGIGSFINTRLVGRLGMRRLGHGALVGFVAVAFLQMAAAYVFDGRPPLVVFGLLLAAANLLFALTVPNFNAMSMEPLGRVAGTASSLIGFYTTLTGAGLGAVVGQSFDGTVLPLGIGYFTLSLLTLAVVAWTEHGRLFQPGRG